VGSCNYQPETIYVYFRTNWT